MTKKKEDIPFETKKDLVLAIANPDMPAETIIDKFLKKDMTAERRKILADSIEAMRSEHADKLSMLRKHTDENGNYKP